MTTSRRDLLHLFSLAAAAGCVVSLPRAAFAASSDLIYGVQLYMVRKEAAQNLAEVLKAIDKIGFTQIELYPIAYTHPPAELKQIVAASGLGCVSAHFDYAGFETRIDYARQLGLTYMVCPMIPHDQWTTAGFQKAAEDFNHWGKMVKDAGMTFAFHNHCYEFKPMDPDETGRSGRGGVTGWQTLMHNTDASLVKLEFDLYWLAQAGQDPSAMLARYAHRVVLLHLKDRTPGAPTGFVLDASAEHFTELGKGSLAWPRILDQARQQGINYAFLDQDKTDTPVLESMKESFDYLKNLNL